MSKVPIKVLLDKEFKPFIPFTTVSAIQVEDGKRTLEELVDSIILDNKAKMEEMDKVIGDANTAIKTANTATSNANTAANSANSAASAANTAATKATNAASTADTATSKANTATTNANTATTNANNAAASANKAASDTNAAIANANAQLEIMKQTTADTENVDINTERLDDGVSVTITNRDGESKTVEVKDGPKGDTGEKGEKGDPGIPAYMGTNVFTVYDNATYWPPGYDFLSDSTRKAFNEACIAYGGVLPGILFTRSVIGDAYSTYLAYHPTKQSYIGTMIWCQSSTSPNTNKAELINVGLKVQRNVNGYDYYLGYDLSTSQTKCSVQRTLLTTVNKVAWDPTESYHPVHKLYVDNAIASKLVGVYKYKGTRPTFEDIQQITNPAIGDVYEAQDTGENYAWDGTKWDDLGNNKIEIEWATPDDILSLFNKEDTNE